MGERASFWVRPTDLPEKVTFHPQGRGFQFRMRKDDHYDIVFSVTHHEKQGNLPEAVTTSVFCVPIGGKADFDAVHERFGREIVSGRWSASFRRENGEYGSGYNDSIDSRSNAFLRVMRSLSSRMQLHPEIEGTAREKWERAALLIREKWLWDNIRPSSPLR